MRHAPTSVHVALLVADGMYCFALVSIVDNDLRIDLALVEVNILNPYFHR